MVRTVDIDFGWTALDPDAPAERRDSGDPLGLRAWATRTTRRLIPVFTPQHQTLWGFAVLCGGRRIAGESATGVGSRDEGWLRFESAWVSAQTRHLADEPTLPRWRGLQRAKEQASRARVPLGSDTPLLMHQMTQGTWGAYRRGAIALGLLRMQQSGQGTSPNSTALTPRGTEMGGWFLSKLLKASGQRALVEMVSSGYADGELLDLIPAASRPPLPRLARSIEECLEVEAKVDLKSLRRAFDENNARFQSPRSFPDGFLVKGQAEALSSARIVLDLVEALEYPYRLWMLGEEPPSPTHATSAPDAEMLAARDQEFEVLELLERARDGGWDAVHSWQQELAHRRASQPFERNEVPESYGDPQVPSFGLRSLAGLFAEGLFGPTVDDWWSRSDLVEEEG